MSIAPVLATVTALAVALWSQPSDKKLCEAAKLATMTSMPIVVPVVGGWLLCYIDNVIILLSSEQQALDWRERLQRNCKQWNAIIKDDNIDIRDTHTEPVLLLGTEVAQADGVFRVRIAPKKVEAWRGLLARLEAGEIVKRTWVAAAVSVGIYVARVRGTRLLEKTAVLEVGRRIAIEVGAHPTRKARVAAWRLMTTLSREERTLLVDELKDAVANPWAMVRGAGHVRAETAAYASDASATRWGVVALATGTVTAGTFNETESHIFYKELEALLKAAESSDPARDVLILCDNSAVVAAVRRGYSPTKRGQALLKAVFDAGRGGS
jgi:hypothetical protein